MSSSGENAEALRRTIDFIRFSSIFVLIIHFYAHLYPALEYWGLTIPLLKKVLLNLYSTGLTKHFHTSKLFALGLLAISLIGSKGKIDPKISKGLIAQLLSTGVLFYFGSALILYLPIPLTAKAMAYITVTAMGFLLILGGGSLLSRLLKDKLSGETFNTLNETFPQEERLLQTPYSINLPARYNLKGKIRNSIINLINAFRGVLVLGSPGSLGSDPVRVISSSVILSRSTSVKVLPCWCMISRCRI
ncbi:MAG TPA: YWFCY domain-containing protein [Chitinophaga sp.]|uniref:YWFCY domain-containing protein n=1 Tax=Chitinophaga sp. TaxID=1869181 RepID=UPI002BD6AFEE|nr:YWFCY domain-containing protein [Chitinophaga sp.]HVI44581.1 YWFCY domain-containing protein [Chitinophaga sp.]